MNILLYFFLVVCLLMAFKKPEVQLKLELVVVDLLVLLCLPGGTPQPPLQYWVSAPIKCLKFHFQ